MKPFAMPLKLAGVLGLSGLALFGMVSAPTASFVLSPSNPAAASPVQFTDTSTGGATTWLWTFGDGGTSTSQSPVHTFVQAGQYSVTLKAGNVSGQTQTTLMVDVSPEDTLRLMAGAGHSFDVTLVATNQHASGNPTGVGKAIPQNDVYGLFTLPTLVPTGPGAPLVPEVFVKMLDARTIANNDFWLFWGQLSDLEYELTVKDNTTGAVKVKNNPATGNRICLGADTSEFNATPTPTATAGSPTPTPTVTPTPGASQTRVVEIHSFFFQDLVSGNNVTTVNVGDTVEWQWKAGPHSTTSGNCPPCTGDGKWDSNVRSAGSKFDLMIMEADRGKSFRYFCKVHLTAMTAVLNVNP
jgi:PKD repeat protein